MLKKIFISLLLVKIFIIILSISAYQLIYHYPSIVDKNSNKMEKILYDELSTVLDSPLTDFEKDIIKGLVFLEDKDFWKRDSAFSFLNFFKLAFRKQGGGSTIPMQVFSQILVVEKKLLKRDIKYKILQTVIAERVFKKLKKEKKDPKIIFLRYYLNNLSFGKGYKGIKSAKLYLFGDKKFNKGYSCYIASMFKITQPKKQFKKFKKRVNHCLSGLYWGENNIEKVKFNNLVFSDSMARAGDENKLDRVLHSSLLETYRDLKDRNFFEKNSKVYISFNVNNRYRGVNGNFKNLSFNLGSIVKLFLLEIAYNLTPERLRLKFKGVNRIGKWKFGSVGSNKKRDFYQSVATSSNSATISNYLGVLIYLLKGKNLKSSTKDIENSDNFLTKITGIEYTNSELSVKVPFSKIKKLAILLLDKSLKQYGFNSNIYLSSLLGGGLDFTINNIHIGLTKLFFDKDKNLKPVFKNLGQEFQKRGTLNRLTKRVKNIYSFLNLPIIGKTGTVGNGSKKNSNIQYHMAIFFKTNNKIIGVSIFVKNLEGSDRYGSSLTPFFVKFFQKLKDRGVELQELNDEIKNSDSDSEKIYNLILSKLN